MNCDAWPANIQMEPTRPTVCAIMTLRRAARLNRSFNSAPSALIRAGVRYAVRVDEAPSGPQGNDIMRRTQYPVRINRDPGSDWGASVPDLPGCVATGKTIDTALRRIERAIEMHVRGLREDGLPVPRSRHRTVTPRRNPRAIDFYATVEVAA